MSTAAVTHTCCNCQKPIVGMSLSSGGVHWHPYSCVNTIATPNAANTTDAPIPLGNTGGGNG